MIRKEILYVTPDGTKFESKEEALDYDKTLSIARTKCHYKMSEGEIQREINKIGEYFPLVKTLLTQEPNWTKWTTENIDFIIFSDLLAPIKKTTIYILEENSPSGPICTELKEEVGPEFTDTSLYCEEDYIVDRVEQTNPLVNKVFYHYKKSYTARIKDKILAGDKLTASELENLKLQAKEVYREEGNKGIWTQDIISVIDIEGELYALEWTAGLVETQKDVFYKQPYPIKLKEEKVTTTQICIIKK